MCKKVDLATPLFMQEVGLFCAFTSAVKRLSLHALRLDVCTWFVKGLLDCAFTSAVRRLSLHVKTLRLDVCTWFVKG